MKANYASSSLQLQINSLSSIGEAPKFDQGLLFNGLQINGMKVKEAIKVFSNTQMWKGKHRISHHDEVSCFVNAHLIHGYFSLWFGCRFIFKRNKDGDNGRLFFGSFESNLNCMAWLALSKTDFILIVPAGVLLVLHFKGMKILVEEGLTVSSFTQ